MSIPEPFVTDEQKNDYDNLVKLSEAVKAEIDRKRNLAIESLLSEELLASKKGYKLKTFVEERVYFDSQEIIIDNETHSYCEINHLANKLYNDKSFEGNDSYYVINGLAFYNNNISFYDIILAFHNYRLNRDEEDLWFLSLMLCRYIYAVLYMGSSYKKIDFGSNDSIKELKELSRYVIEFWEKYLKDININKFVLSDDKKVDFYDKIDKDADHYFAVMDAVDDEEIKQIDTDYAEELINQCSKSLYLLLSTLREIGKDELVTEIKELRKVINDLCETIYSNELDSYGDLYNDNRLNVDKITIKEKNNEIRLLQLTLQDAIDRLKNLDTKEKLENRKELMQTVYFASDTDELVESFSKEFSKQLIDSIESLDVYYNRLKQELGHKYSLLHEESARALASAEYLFDLFVKHNAPKEFDYSGIAVLYFQAFETAYDKLIIEPYSKWLCENGVDNLFKERQAIKKIRLNLRTNEQKNRLGEIEDSLCSFFSKSFDKDRFYNKGCLNTSLEIGAFQRFINIGEHINSDEKAAKKLVYFLENKCFNKKVSMNAINNFSESVLNATNPRNVAAHGLKGLEKKDVIADKEMVYDETNIEHILDYKNLLYELLSFFNY